jgi:hypothetical protein
MRCLPSLRAGVVRHAARLLLLALTASALGPLVHGIHEEACEPALVLHDERNHHVQGTPAQAGTATTGEHCVACHLARSSRGLVAWEPTGRAPLDRGVLLADAARALAAAPSPAPRPARAPPSLV